MGDTVREFGRADDGGVALEYGLLAALVAGVVLFGLSALGSNLNGRFSLLASGMAGAEAASPGDAGSSNNGKGGGGNNGKGNGAANGGGNGGPKGNGSNNGKGNGG